MFPGRDMPSALIRTIRGIVQQKFVGVIRADYFKAGLRVLFKELPGGGAVFGGRIPLEFKGPENAAGFFDVVDFFLTACPPKPGVCYRSVIGGFLFPFGYKKIFP
jgi:hypothetical protein